MLRRGRKSAAQTPAPKSERIYGSKKNVVGSAASKKSASTIKLNDKIVKSLTEKAREYNENHSGKVTVSTLKAVYRRGLGAYSSSHRPTITGGVPNSRNAWAMARVNKFLLKKSGKKVKAAYVQDDDLMAKGGKVFEKGGKFKQAYGDGYLEKIWELLDKEYVIGDEDYFETNLPIGNIYIEKKRFKDGTLKSYSLNLVKDNSVILNTDKISNLTKKQESILHNIIDSLENKFDLIAPNGKPSKLNAEQYALVRTPEFKAWFGDWENSPETASKVVDINGEPLVVYHGTYVKEQFYVFDFDKADLGFHFGTYEQAKERSQTKMYVQGYKSIINPYFLNIRKLVNVHDVGEWEYPQRYIDTLISEGLIIEKEAKQNGFLSIYNREDNKLVRDFLINKFGNIGFDYENKIESKGLSYLVLEPEQIKLADGSNTTFDANNPDIRFAKGGKTKGGGDCYYMAGQFAMNNFFTPKKIDYIGTPYLIHAEVQGQGAISNLRYGHAWIEDDIFVYDFSNNREFVIPKDFYYQLGDVKTDNPKKYRKYTFQEARKKMVDTGNYGCWDLEVEYAEGGTLSELLAPNGKPSKLNAEQYALVRTPEFKAWFGDWENSPETASKVVDENGEPLVLYRGNLVNQEELGYTFNLGQNFLKKQSSNTFGFFFTKNIDIAKKYMLVDHFDEIRGGSLTDVFIKSNKVLDLKEFDLKISQNSFIESLIQKGISFDNEYKYLEKKILDFDSDTYKYWGNNVFDYFDAFPELRNLFIKNGFNSVIFYEMSRSYSKYEVYVVFNSNQIKLADGTNTTFDANNPDIRYDGGGEVDNYIFCENCGWNWKESETTEDDKYICHKCQHDNETSYIMSKFKTPKTIAELSIIHGISEDLLNEQLEKGIEIELEHTTDRKIAETIALHHLEETPYYYTKLKEANLEDGGVLEEFETDEEIEEILPELPEMSMLEYLQQEKDESKNLVECHDETKIYKAMVCKAKIEVANKCEADAEGLEKNLWNEVKIVWQDALNSLVNQKNVDVKKLAKGGKADCGCGMYARGGLAYGNSHNKGGMPLKVKSTGQNIEIEGGEGVINKRSMQMTKKVSYQGKQMTPCEVISKINEMGGGVKFNCNDVKNIIDEDGSF